MTSMKVTSKLFQKTSLVGVLFVALSACGKNSKPANNVVANPEYSAQTEAQIASIFANSRVDCANERNCNPSVAFLVVVDTVKGIASVCSGFVVDTNKIMTNSHCVPEHLKSPRSDCKNRIHAYFPQTGSYFKTDVGCSRVLRASELNPKTGAAGPNLVEIDYALLETEYPISRPAVALSGGEVADGEVLRSDRVNPLDGDYPRGLLVSESCEAVMKTALYPAFHRGDSPFVTSRCNVISGNSGSPLFGRDGKVRAITQAVPSDTFKKVFSKLMLEPAAPMSFASRLGCIQFEEIGFTPRIADECSRRVSYSGYEGALSWLFEDADDRFTAQFKDEARRNGAYSEFDWAKLTVTQDLTARKNPDAPTETQVVAAPACFVSPKSWIGRHSQGAGQYSRSAKETVTLPRFNAKVGLDRLLKPAMKIRYVDSVNVDLLFNADELTRNSEFADRTFQVSIAQTAGAQKFFDPVMIPVCRSE